MKKPSETTRIIRPVTDERSETLSCSSDSVLSSVNFDPKIASYDIRTGVVEGNGGTSIASGTARIKVALTGRTLFGMTEYALLVRLPEAQYLEEGEYWFNVTATCTNGAKDGSCYVGRIYLSNTTQDTNGISADAQPTGSMPPFFPRAAR